jgi:hypothetical protein
VAAKHSLLHRSGLQQQLTLAPWTLLLQTRSWRHQTPQRLQAWEVQRDSSLSFKNCNATITVGNRYMCQSVLAWKKLAERNGFGCAEIFS